MKTPHPAAGSALTWALAVLLVAAIDAAVTHSSLLWGKTNLWVRKGGFERMYIWQPYEVAQKIYYPRRDAPVRVALLGNSRIWFPAREAYVERELKRLAPDLDVRVDNLAFWGAKVGDLEIVSRHLKRLHPTLVVLTLGYGDLVATSWSKLVNPTGELLNIGWRDGPLPAENFAVRADRWARTAWPLYRFRRFVKEVIKDRVFPEASDTHFPDHFTSTREFFTFVQGPRGNEVEEAYQAWRANPSLANFVSYLNLTRTAFGLSEPLPGPESLTLESPGLRILDHLLARLADGPGRSIILLMPENPLLDQDTEAQYHRPGFSDRSAALIRQLAERHGIPVVDGRRWMPAETFADFFHAFPDLSGFQTPLAEEILHAIGS